MKKDVFLEGEKIYLRAPKTEDLRGCWYRWFNDWEVTKYQNKGIVPNTRQKQREYFHSILKSKNDVLFAIVDKKSDRHIGCVGIHKIDWIHRSAELGIVIGEKKFWGKGCGKEAWNLATWYGFNVLNLHRISAFIFRVNTASKRSALASGFRIEGLLREAFFKNGRYHSVLAMSALEDDFKKND
ncbi:MAG TPA: hypothetical protein DCL49_13265 [Candidatus Omnitrophica bacterium]|nr:hypothetical protein [Candidatus Omnitrophota bacterium]HCD38979.1 hypothetical protein [Candidatus Omnitrophota bacterium]